MKKVLAFFLTSVMLCLCIAPQFSSFASVIVDDTFTLGDVNGDGDVNSLDSYAMRCCIAGFSSTVNTDPADFDADGKVSARDVFCLKAFFADKAELSDYGADKPFCNIKIGGKYIDNYVLTVEGNIDPDGKTDSVQRAVDIFQRTVLDVSGIYIPTCKEEDVNGKNVIMFHVVGLGEERVGHTFGIEDYYYKVADGRLDIYASAYRGNIYAVYEILEKYFGIRWFDMSDTFVYKTRCVDIPVGEENYHTSCFSYRYGVENFCDPGSRAGALNYFFPARLNGTQIGAYTTDYYGTLTGPHALNAHSFQDYWKMSDGDSKVEDDGTLSRFELLKKKYNAGTEPSVATWQPCATATDSYDKLFGGMLLRMEMIFSDPKNNNILRTDEGLSCMSFSICDNSNYCTCHTCSSIRNGTATTLRSVLDVENFKKAFLGKYEITQNGRTYTLKFVGPEGDSGLYVNLTNRAALDIQQYYPGLRLYTIIYDHTVPASVRPNEFLNIMYCGQGCNNHILGSGGCGDNLTFLKSSNKETEISFPKWAEMCHENGAEIWFWYYPITCGFYLTSCPNIVNIYYDFKFIYESGADGIYYEGEADLTIPKCNYETLKAYMGAKMMWQPDMTYEKYTEYLKEYLYIYYGDGYEYIYKYLLLDDESGNACGCFVNNHDRPFDMHSRAYLSEHYEEMRSLLLAALPLTKTLEQYDRLELMFNCFEFMGLSASYDRMYVGGTEDEQRIYTERYTEMLEYMQGIDLMIFYAPDMYCVPDEVDLSENPMLQFYGLYGWTTWAQG